MYALDRRLIFLFVVLYAIASLICIFTYAPFHDTLYYWDWGRHLALSYFDGPPLVAYLIHGFTLLFGSSSQSINFIGLICNLIITFFIYQLSKFLFNKNIALLSILLWIFSSSSFIQYNLKVEYDTPVTLFWIMTLYLFAIAHFQKKSFYLYLAGISAGLMMLSKYTGVILFLSIFIMMLFSKDYRGLFKNKHLYFSGALSVIVFSPVIIWNFQHHFTSFLFQLNHGFKHLLNYNHILQYIMLTFSMYHLIFTLFIYFIIMNRKKAFSDPRLEIILYPALTTFLFFLFVSPYSFKNNWNNTFYITAVIFVAYCLMQNIKWRKIVPVIFIFNFLIIGTITLFILNNGALFSYDMDYGGHQSKSDVLNIRQYYHPGDIVFTSHYTLGSELAFYLPNHPEIYSFSSGGHQYRYWSKNLKPLIKENKVRKILYITKNDFVDYQTKHWFPICKRLNNGKNTSLKVYRCFRS